MKTTCSKILILFLLIGLFGCKKTDPQPTNWTVTFKVTGKGTYHLSADLTQQGHFGNSYEPTLFTMAAQKGSLIEIDAIADTSGQSVSISMDIVPVLGAGHYAASGTVMQKIQYQN